MNVKLDVEQQANVQVLRLIDGFTYTFEDDRTLDLVRIEAKTVFLTWRQVRLTMGKSARLAGAKDGTNPSDDWLTIKYLLGTCASYKEQLKEVEQYEGKMSAELIARTRDIKFLKWIDALQTTFPQLSAECWKWRLQV